MKRITTLLLALTVSGYSIAEADDANWYTKVFGEDLTPEFSGGGYNTYDGWSGEKKTHYASVDASASVTIGCEGVKFDGAFSHQFDNLFSDIEGAMQKPVMILISAASYFIGSAYEVINNISGQITETMSGLIGSCENSGKALADFTADKIPELGKYRCGEENGGNDRECLAESLSESTNEFLKEWGQDLVDSTANKLNDKIRPKDSLEKWYILGRQNLSYCERKPNDPSYLHEVYASTNMTCFEMHAARNLLGNVTILTRNAEGNTVKSGGEYKKKVVDYETPSTNIESYFVEVSAAYGEALLEIVTSDNYENTEGWNRWSRSPYTDSTNTQFLNLASIMNDQGKQGRLVNIIRLKADMAAQTHIEFEFNKILEYIAQYDASEEQTKIVLDDNPLLLKSKAIGENMEDVEKLRQRRIEEVKLMNEIFRQE